MSINVLGIDVSKERTGWALVDDYGIAHYGCIKCPSHWSNTKHNDPEFNDLLHWYYNEISCVYNKLDDRIDIVAVAMEDLNIQYAKTAKVMLQLQAAARLAITIASEQNTVINLVHNQTIKSMYKIRFDKVDKSTKNLKIKELAKINKVKEVKVLMVNSVNKVHNLNLDYYQNDEADAIALAYTFIIKKAQGTI